MATEVVRDVTEGGKINPEVISRTAEVPWVNHFVAQEALLMVTKQSAQGSRASIEVTRGE